MAGIYIPGMEMPKNCFDCDFSLFYNEMADLVCPILRGEVSDCGFNTLEERHPDCPLVPVPNHGRLINADALWVEINKICDRRDAEIITDLTCLQQILSAVRHAPTVIPADKEVTS